MVAGQWEEAGTEELKRKVKDLEDVLIEQWEYNGEREGEQVLMLKVPPKPTEKGTRGTRSDPHFSKAMVQVLHDGKRSPSSTLVKRSGYRGQEWPKQIVY